MKKRKAQIWISTVIYVLIGISLISALLLAAKPKIEQSRDKFTINYMITALNSLDLLIREVNDVIGTRRSFEVKINKGTLKIDPQEDLIEWSYNIDFEFSEPDKVIEVDAVKVLTKKTGGTKIYVYLNYSNSFINVTTSKNSEGNKISLTQSSLPYKLWIENLGPTSGIKNAIYISSQL